MDLKETEARNDCAVEVQQQCNRILGFDARLTTSDCKKLLLRNPEELKPDDLI
jgi:hypothetical protein